MDRSDVLEEVRRDPEHRDHVVPSDVRLVDQGRHHDGVEDPLGQLPVQEPVDRNLALSDKEVAGEAGLQAPTDQDYDGQEGEDQHLQTIKNIE